MYQRMRLKGESWAEPRHIITVNSEGYYNRAVLNNLKLAVGCTAKSAYIIWGLAELDEEYDP